ncbi:MAG: MOSC domain-containing protein [Deltaproteobacteria bacterium]|nr:MOSC domain-containing protein [Deltaproteobacteria bacterium]
MARPRTDDELATALDDIRGAPRDAGSVELIVRRPKKNEREILDRGDIDPAVGLTGDNWSTKPSSKTGKPNPNAQLTLMNVRAVRALAEHSEWPLAGDNLYVDLDLSPDNLPPGTRLIVGEALLEITEDPHTGCAKFTQRFGSAATKWVNSKVGRALNLRGVNARVITGGAIRRGDPIKKA